MLSFAKAHLGRRGLTMILIFSCLVGYLWNASYTRQTSSPKTRCRTIRPLIKGKHPPPAFHQTILALRTVFTMSLLLRAFLVFVQALSNHWACTPPNKTPEKGRYNTEEAYILQIAPLIFKVHTSLMWLIAALETLSVMVHYSETVLPQALASHMDGTIFSFTRSLTITPLFLIGVLLSVVGMLIRVQCFRELGHLFTFDLTIHPEHKLVTSGYYRYVRHPSYTGSMLVIMGLTFSQLTAGSLAVECSILGQLGSRLLWGVWWIWTLSVGISRAVAEDGELQKLFGSEWDAYAATTKYWFVPGLC